MDEQTRQNVLTAMHGEAFAYAKYMLFAREARQSGETDLARLFEETAKVELLEHFAEEAELVGLVGTNAENLRDAIEGESHEVEEMYRRFAKQAELAGESAAAERFLEVRQDEMGHRNLFQAALDQLEKAAAKTR